MRNRSSDTYHTTLFEKQALISNKEWNYPEYSDGKNANSMDRMLGITIDIIHTRSQEALADFQSVFVLTLLLLNLTNYLESTNFNALLMLCAHLMN